MFNIYRLALAVPELHPADVKFNQEKIIEAYRKAVTAGASLVVFPELAVTGSSCGILFKQMYLLDRAAAAANDIAAATGDVPAVFGVPVLCGGKVLNTMVWASHGEIAAVTVKDSADQFLDGERFPSGTLFDCGGLTVSVEFAGDFPQDTHAMLRIFAGAEPRLPGAERRHREFARTVSGCSGAAVAEVFAGNGESGTDVIYGGKPVCACNGRVLSGGTVSEAPEVCFYDLDGDILAAAQLNKTPASQSVLLEALPQAPDLQFFDNPAHPFMPENPVERREFCDETLSIQAEALALRYFRSYSKSMVIGISGGLDSTLALVVIDRCCNEFQIPRKNIIAVTMPGFGTTGRTKNNALRLAELIGASIREIPITAACGQHFADIGHDPQKHDSVYENTQARERTQILMDIANQTGGIVVGTGDLSEIALGWCTFNGDHMAMYNVNSSIPKSSIALLLECAAAGLPAEAAAILQDVINTPVSPELLPPDENGEIGQKTEAILGAYELHDYFLWQFLNGVSEPEKVLVLAEHAFAGKYPAEEVRRVRELFCRRFFTQQFKRTAAPDGIQAGPFSLSARGAWQMGADITGAIWRS
ncbi:MAG: NAD(+) synthase [Lentisphaeria bacterium]|nr:NAD(+) synthase [Lentisphaeria bacterium]